MDKGNRRERERERKRGTLLWLRRRGSVTVRFGPYADATSLARKSAIAVTLVVPPSFIFCLRVFSSRNSCRGSPKTWSFSVATTLRSEPPSRSAPNVPLPRQNLYEKETRRPITVLWRSFGYVSRFTIELFALPIVYYIKAMTGPLRRYFHLSRPRSVPTTLFFRFLAFVALFGRLTALPRFDSRPVSTRLIAVAKGAPRSLAVDARRKSARVCRLLEEKRRKRRDAFRSSDLGARP